MAIHTPHPIAAAPLSQALEERSRLSLMFLYFLFADYFAKQFEALAFREQRQIERLVTAKEPKIDQACGDEHPSSSPIIAASLLPRGVSDDRPRHPC